MAIKNEQSRHWQHWAHTTQEEDKQSTKTQHNTTQKTKKMSNTNLTENRGEPGAHEGEPVPASYT